MFMTTTTPALTPATRPPKILLHPESEQATGRYRCMQPATALAQAGAAVTRSDFVYADDATLKAAAPDVVIFRQPVDDTALAALARYRKALPGARIVVDADDLLWGIPASNPFGAQFPADTRARLRKAMRTADAVVASTQALADRIVADLGIPRAKTVVSPNYLSRAFVNAARSGHRQRPSALSRPRVGWAGGVSHAEDLKLLVPVVEATRGHIQWVFMGQAPDVDLTGIEFHPAVAYDDYAKALAGLRLDLAVAPLADTAFNACKSDLRILELVAAGVCVLASPVPAFADAPVAFSTDDAWGENINRLLRDADEREARAEAQHRWLMTTRIQDLQDAVMTTAEAWAGAARAFNPWEMPAVDDVVYIRPGATVSDEAIHRLKADVACGAAAACALSNDGDYPIRNQFVPLPGPVASAVAAAAQSLWDGGAPTSLQVSWPHPTGPAVVLGAEAVAVVGLPDPNLDFELAVVDWGNRARSLGLDVILDHGVFVHAPESRQHSEADLKQVLGAAAFWYPDANREAVTMLQTDSGLAARAAIDCRHLRDLRAPGPEGLRLLLVNGDGPTIAALAQEGHVAIPAGLGGFFLQLPPEMLPSTPAFDLREPVTRLAATLRALAIDIVVVNGLRTGSVDVLGAFLALRDHGFRVQYEAFEKEAVCPRLTTATDAGPCGDLWKVDDDLRGCQACVNRLGSAHGYVSAQAYRSSWMRFLDVVLADVVPRELAEADASDEVPAGG